MPCCICVVVVRFDKVIDRLGVAGRLPGLLCLPQYFTRAMFGCAWAVVVFCIAAQCYLISSGGSSSLGLEAKFSGKRALSGQRIGPKCASSWKGKRGKRGKEAKK